jgi:hypothetical protein
VLSGSILEDLSPHARVATAVAPFVLAILLRFLFGSNRLTRVLLSLSTVWFAVNVLLAPFSARMQQDILQLRGIFR